MMISISTKLAVSVGLCLLLLVSVAMPVAAKQKEKGRRWNRSSMDDDLECSACELVCNKIERLLNMSDPGKTIEIGSRFEFTKKIPYARSLAHVTEVLDTVCDSFQGSVAMQTLNDGRRKFMPMNRIKAGQSLNNVSFDPRWEQQVKYECQRLLEEQEDRFEQILHRNMDEHIHLTQKVCQYLSGTCDFIDSDDTAAEDNEWDDIDSQFANVPPEIRMSIRNFEKKEERKKEKKEWETEEEKKERRRLRREKKKLARMQIERQMERMLREEDERKTLGGEREGEKVEL